jgi:hypothetical protein
MIVGIFIPEISEERKWFLPSRADGVHEKRMAVEAAWLP